MNQFDGGTQVSQFQMEVFASENQKTKHFFTEKKHKSWIPATFIEVTIHYFTACVMICVFPLILS